MAEIIDQINWTGIIIGLSTFLIIGIFHPLVIKGYYYFGLRCRIAFLIAGLISLTLCAMVSDTIASVLLGVTAFSCFWSIKAVNEQKLRGERGWFPGNPRLGQKQSVDQDADASPADV
ncbi:MAG: DUF4491 family protein [Muribaculaceae bacterium]|nr:DUF4491 family protein [Muribaculaceae bacterium]